MTSVCPAELVHFITETAFFPSACSVLILLLLWPTNLQHISSTSKTSPYFISSFRENLSSRVVSKICRNGEMQEKNKTGCRRVLMVVILGWVQRRGEWHGDWKKRRGQEVHVSYLCCKMGLCGCFVDARESPLQCHRLQLSHFCVLLSHLNEQPATLPSSDNRHRLYHSH